jgi:Mce-associated membrane protein
MARALTRSVPTRRVLTVVALVLLGLAGLEVWYLLGGGPEAGDDRPVVVGDLTARSGVDAAAQDLTEIASTSYRNYDEQVDQATTLMTPEFATQYRATAASLAPTFAEQRREIAAQVLASAVVRATDQQVQALVFLDSRVSEGGGRPVRLPYRTLVTMTRTDHGWLVSNIETR